MSNLPTTDPPSVGPGSVLGGKYRVEKIIGSGGMGIVVAARHVSMGHRVAIKILNLDEEADRADAIARFAREARAAARIESDHVVRVMDVASLSDGTPYMVMEYLEGTDLKELVLDRDQLPIAEAVGYVLEACEGLSEAHAAGVIHRDLKPSNLFLAKKGSRTLVKILDFGISKVAPRKGELAITTTNSLMGSPMYMSPEQMKSSRDVDSRADIWSLGLILYELLTGEVPFRGETIPEICIAVMNGEPEPITRFRSDVPEGLQAVLRKCLAKDRNARYPTTAALARDLVPFALAGARVHAERASAALKVVRAVSDPPGEHVEGTVSVGEQSEQLVPEPASRRGSETLKSWSTGRGMRGMAAGTRRTLWLGLVAVVSTMLAVVIGARLARGPSSETESTLGPTPTREPTYATNAATQPPATGDVLVSVPVDSLPLVARDAGAPRAPRAVVPQAQPSASSSPPSLSVSAAPSAAPPTHAKDDWKWGDRN